MTNKELVLNFYNDVFNGWNTDAIDSYIAEGYIQHNPGVESGRAGFHKFAEHFLAMKPHMEIVKIGEDGDMVYVFFKCTMGNGSVNKVCDIYRVENGMLAEHWDVVEHDVGSIPAANDNGLF